MLRFTIIAILWAGAISLAVEEADQLRDMFSEAAAAAEAPSQCIEAPKINNISRILLNPAHPAGATLWPQTDIYLAYKANGNSPLAAAVRRETENFDDEWVHVLCPEVVDYFKLVKYFDYTAFPGRYPPLLTTNAAASAVCLLRVFDAACRRIGAQWFMYAGSHLGAVAHGGPIPWDDDADVLFDYHKKDELVEELRRMSIPGVATFAIEVRSHARRERNAVKVFVSTYPKTTEREPPDLKWPFIDAFPMKVDSILGIVHEMSTHQRIHKHVPEWPFKAIFPLRPYFFGGIVVPGPPRALASARYNLSSCVSPVGNHRFSGFRQRGVENFELSCCRLSKHFPFVRTMTSARDDNVELEVIHVNQVPVHVTRVSKTTGEVLDMAFVAMSASGVTETTPMKTYTDAASSFSLQLPESAFSQITAFETWNITLAQRDAYLLQIGRRRGYSLTQELRNLSFVEVDNSISTSCTRTTSLKVVEFNAARGTHWFLGAHMLRAIRGLADADVIFLNEMDIGMARSRNEHTTRLLAHALGLNYAWGLEFLELTNGDENEQQSTEGQINKLGLHGNAILSKCPIRDAALFRDELDNAYFSSTPSFTNANGFEKRLGGRCAIVALYETPTTNFTVASIHKIFSEKNVAVLRAAALKGRGTVFAGDQPSVFCAKFGLRHSGDLAHKTTGAWCSGSRFRGHHGDIICSDMDVVGSAVTNLPCAKVSTDKTVQLSDHGFTAIQLGRGKSRMELSPSSGGNYYNSTSLNYIDADAIRTYALKKMMRRGKQVRRGRGGRRSGSGGALH
jgi:endonuclease/exonuclease/phosphatase family metal-dependent hydrolase